MTRVLGADISKWQDDNNTPRMVDFAKMRAEGIQFVIIRAGQGTVQDPDFVANYAAAKAAGLARGVYHFFDSRATPLAQALMTAAIIGTDYPEVGVWADLEENYGGPYLGWRNWINYLASLKSKLPEVGIYTAPYYWMLNRPTDAESLAYFKSFPLWIAHYNVSTPLVPSPWTGWLFWQYTSSGDGLRYGAESLEIDLDWFNGDEQTFRNYFDLGEVPQPPQEQTMEKIGTVTADALNMRSSTATTSTANIVGKLYRGDRAIGTVDGSWMHIRQVVRVGGQVQAWDSFAHVGYMTLADYVEPPAEDVVYPASIVLNYANGVQKTYIPE